MTYNAGGYGPAGPPPPGYGPPPQWQPPGYGPAYGAPGYPPPYGPPPVLKPGVVPLRPLTLADMFNGAVAYIRANPKATLGLTTIVVVAAQIVTLVLSLWPIAVTGDVAESLGGDPSTDFVVGWMASALAGGVTAALSMTVLSGLLTVVIGRSVFGAGITVKEAWYRLRPRFWALIGFSLLKTLALVLWFAVAGAFVAGAVTLVEGPAAFLIAAPVVLAAILVAIWASVMLTFSPVIIVLERRDILTSIQRSFSLIKGDFWRVFGIWLLAYIVTQFVAGAVSIPFAIGSQLALTASVSTVSFLISLVLSSLGGAVGQIITGPFSAGVVVLQYADRRIRAEAFDLVLQTGAAAGPAAPADSTDDLWLTGPR